jgi:signal transduction histidine kinase
MRLKAKIFLLAIVPFLLAIAGIGFGVRQQATSLAARSTRRSRRRIWRAGEAAQALRRARDQRDHAAVRSERPQRPRRRDAAHAGARDAAEDGLRPGRLFLRTTCTAIR